MEEFLHQYALNLVAALQEGRISFEKLTIHCEFCPLKEQCGEAADNGDNRSCEQFIRANTQ